MERERVVNEWKEKKTLGGLNKKTEKEIMKP